MAALLCARRARAALWRLGAARASSSTTVGADAFSAVCPTTGLALEAGRLARLADGAAVAALGDTKVLATAVSDTAYVADRDFMPLQVDYRERAYAVGRIPATFTRREGSPKDREVLLGRAIDRALRPLFPKGYYYDTQVMLNVLSADSTQDPDVLCINAASAALMLSDIPFAGPVGAVRVGCVDGELVVNPTVEQAERSALNLLYAGNDARTLMIEADAPGAGVSEARFAEALRFAHAAVRGLLPVQLELAQRLGKPKREARRALPDAALKEAVEGAMRGPTREALHQFGLGKAERARVLARVKGDTFRTVQEMGFEQPYPVVDAAMEKVLSSEIRRMAFEEGVRVDGRGLRDLRQIVCEVGVLPRVHGSSLFERGDTQALATVTVGGLDDAQRLDSLVGPGFKRLMLHYGFPPFSVNETGRSGGLSRREVGHGALAEKALAGSLPSDEEFPFCVRINSETLGSNGSSSMAAVCSGSLALMEAGVPMPKPIAGISVGLVMDEDEETGDVRGYRLLRDIQGMEDGLGDMDFKVAGSAEGITAVQLDCKPAGIPTDILVEALDEARDARLELLEIMGRAIAAPRTELHDSAPRFGKIQVEQEMVGRVIGPQGSTVREIERASGGRLTVSQDGVVSIFAATKAQYELASSMVHDINALSVKVGETYLCRVVSLKDFGAFVQPLHGGDQGLLHISEVSHGRTNRMEDVMEVDQEIELQCIAKDTKGNIKWSRKALLPVPERVPLPPRTPPIGSQAARERQAGSPRGPPRGRA